MKVCQFIDTYYPIVDGAINVSKYYAQSVNKIECSYLATPKPAKKYKETDEFEVVRCFSLPAPEKYRCGVPAFDLKFKRRMQKEKFDILHAHSPYTMGRIALKLGKKCKVPVVATLHTQYKADFERVYKGNKFWVNFALKYIIKVYNKADSVWTVSQRSVDVLRSYGYKGDAVVVRNGTNFTYPDNAEQLIEKVNELHELKGQKNVFLFLGRMVWYKNLKLICDGLKVLKDKGEDFKMLFVGGGFDYQEVYDYAEKLGITDKCIFTGQVSDSQMLQAYYLRSDLILYPSTCDMAPVAKVEAAAHNKASLVVASSCSAELVEDGVNGFLCDETIESFSNKLIELCSNPELVKQAGDNARKTIYRSWDMVGEEVVEKYKQVIENYKNKQRELEQLKKNKRKNKNKKK
ncbi:MAG: glycosyltransferase [Clostridia bacterium]|nr:glycosyltransferase [Clostridia bacterium]